jgi:hypothetical protein
MKDPQRCSGTTRAGGEEGLVDPAELRSSDLAGEHLHLVPKDDDSISSSRSALRRPDPITRRSNG